MMDFWTVLGNLVIDYPNLFNIVTNLKPGFTPIVMTVTQITYDNPPKVKTFQKAAAGYLIENDTSNLRDKLSSYVRTKYGTSAPVISLYTAGKLCQLVNTFPGFKAALQNANSLVMAATSNNPPATMWFAALLGACLIDSNLTDAVKDPAQWDIANEFGGIDPGDEDSEEGQAILSILNSQRSGFANVQRAILAAPSWDQCKEQLLWYPGFEDAAN